MLAKSTGPSWRNNSIGMIFTSSIEYSSKVNPVWIQHLNGILFDECKRNHLTFVDNEAVSKLFFRIYESLSENNLSSEKTSTSNLNSEKLDNSEINLTYHSNSRSINNVFLNSLSEIHELRLPNVIKS